MKKLKRLLYWLLPPWIDNIIHPLETKQVKYLRRLKIEDPETYERITRYNKQIISEMLNSDSWP